MSATAASTRTAIAAVAGMLLLLSPAVPAAAAETDRQVVARGAQWFVAGGPSFSYGRTSDVQVMGDWNDDGSRTPGVFRAGTWHLRNSLSAGPADIVVSFGRDGDLPVVGDWDGDGRTGIGIVRRGTCAARRRAASPRRRSASAGPATPRSRATGTARVATASASSVPAGGICATPPAAGRPAWRSRTAAPAMCR